MRSTAYSEQSSRDQLPGIGIRNHVSQRRIESQVASAYRHQESSKGQFELPETRCRYRIQDTVKTPASILPIPYVLVLPFAPWLVKVASIHICGQYPRDSCSSEGRKCYIFIPIVLSVCLCVSLTLSLCLTHPHPHANTHTPTPTHTQSHPNLFGSRSKITQSCLHT